MTGLPNRARAGFLVAVAAALIGWVDLVCGATPANADPVPPADPAVPLPSDPAAVTPIDGVPPAPQSLLGQVAGALAQTNPLSAMTGLLAGSAQPPAVGATPPPPGAPPATDPWAAAQLLLPQNYRMPTADQTSPYALAPNDTPSPFARIDAFKGVHALLHSNLGRMPGDQLGQSLPGTAAAPGSNLPPGLEQFYVDPAAVPSPADAGTPDPLLLPVTPPN